MNIKEYNNVKDLSYFDYCDYLHKKYGLPPCAYFDEQYNPLKEPKRAMEGLFLHHKMEYVVGALYDPATAKEYPLEWQSPENLVYGDYLEHAFMHLLIAENPVWQLSCRGSGGFLLIMEHLQDFWCEYFLPEKRKPYSKRKSVYLWEANCFDAVKGDIDVCFALLERSVKGVELSRTIFSLFSDMRNVDNFDAIKDTLVSVSHIETSLS